MKARKGLALGCIGSVVIAAAGCASAPAPKELLDARAAYTRAAAGPAAQLSPASLHEAKVALSRAESAFSEDEDAATTRDVAYVAERKAQMAEADAAAIQARRQTQAAIQQARLAQAAGQQGQLSQARNQLATASAELERERQARGDAEKRAQAAIDQLAAANGAQVSKDERGTIITMPGEVLFQTGKWDLMGNSKSRLERVVDALKAQGDHQIVVEGHTDSVGSDQTNMELSQKRAESVRDYLVSKGIPDDRIKAEGAGEGTPIADNGTASGRAQNRRVELIIEPLK